MKPAAQLENPKHVIAVFQEKRENNVKKPVAKLDLCKIVNLKLYLNSATYSYDDLKLDTENNCCNFV